MIKGDGGVSAVVRMVALALLWGSTFLWISIALEGLAPVQVTLVRCALGTSVLIAWCTVRRLRFPRDRATWGHLVVAAFFCNALPFAMFSLGQQTVDSGVAGVLNATTPLWSLVIGIVIGVERDLRPIRLGGLVLGFGGILLIFAPWQQGGLVSWGALAILVAAASYAVGFIYMGRHLVGRTTPAIALAACQLLVATGLTTVTVPIGGWAPIQLSPMVLIASLLLGVFCTGITFALTFRMIADEGATNTAAVGYLLPVVSVILGAVVLNEGFGARVILGMAIVLVAVGMTRKRVSLPRSRAAGSGVRPGVGR